MHNVAIYGGAFNPPTKSGHFHVASQLTQYVNDIDSIYVMPTFRHVFKPELEQSYQLRIDMCKATFNSNEFFVSDAEKNLVANGGDGSTIQLVEYLKHANPNTNFMCVIGVDNADSIEKWKAPQKLLETISFVVMARGGYTPQLDWYRHGKHRYIEIDAVEISSTAIRTAIHNSDWAFVEKHLDPTVVDIIRKNNIY